MASFGGLACRSGGTKRDVSTPDPGISRMRSGRMIAALLKNATSSGFCRMTLRFFSTECSCHEEPHTRTEQPRFPSAACEYISQARDGVDARYTGDAAGESTIDGALDRKPMYRIGPLRPYESPQPYQQRDFAHGIKTETRHRSGNPVESLGAQQCSVLAWRRQQYDSWPDATSVAARERRKLYKYQSVFANSTTFTARPPTNRTGMASSTASSLRS